MTKPREQSPSSNGRVFGQYLLALLLLALLQAPALVSSLEDLSAHFPPAARLASLLALSAEASGMTRLGSGISAFLAFFSTEREAGALPEPLPPRAGGETPAPQAGQQPPSRLSVSRVPPPSSPAASRPLALPAREVRPPGWEAPSSSLPRTIPGGREVPVHTEPIQTNTSAETTIPGGREVPVHTVLEPSARTLSLRTSVSLAVRSKPPESSAASAGEIRPLARATNSLPPPPLFASLRRKTPPAAEYSASGAPLATLPLPLREIPPVSAAALRSPPRPARPLLPPAPRPGHPDAAFHILLVGDSMMMEGLGPALLRVLRDRADVRVARDARYSTGLSRRDYFDWPLHMAALVDLHAPDLVIIAMGGNDSQDIVDITRKRHLVGTFSWERHYLLRARELLAAVSKEGALALWVGLPVMGNSPHARHTLQVSRQQQAACDPFTRIFVDTLPVLADSRGGYLTYARNAKGVQTRIRQKDKIHLTDAGGDLLAAAVLPRIDDLLQRLAGYRRAALPDRQAISERRSRLEDPALSVTSQALSSIAAPAFFPRRSASRAGKLSLPPQGEDASVVLTPAGAAPRSPGG
ncbi:MAG: DUF459 domain-containing protein [Desulfovibrio sp.]|jgi:hypothetical protein|nr:DUF459 domain-containing protein [Desulfovibrio sp.]